MSESSYLLMSKPSNTNSTCYISVFFWIFSFKH